MSRSFEDLKLHTPGLHLISGQTGAGKTANLFSIADRLHEKTGKDIYVMISPTDRPIEQVEGIPRHIHSLKGSLPPVNSIAIGDDWQRVAHARRAVANINVLVDQLLATLRHDDVDWLLDVQTYASMDRNSIIRTDYLWFRRPYPMEAELGRPELQYWTQEAERTLEGKPKSCAYLSSRAREGYEGLVTGIPLPPYWSDDLSRMHRRQDKPWTPLKGLFR